METIRKGGYDYEGHWVPKKIRCDCGQVLELVDPMTNQCRCGRFFNGTGQLLTHPSQWGEETGEQFDDGGNYVIGSGDPLEDW